MTRKNNLPDQNYHGDNPADKNSHSDQNDQRSVPNLKKFIETRNHRPMVVNRRNLLDMIKDPFSVTEIRLMYTYLACVNPMDQTTRMVKFPLAAYFELMGVDINRPGQVKQAIDEFFSKTFYIPTEDGKPASRHIFQQYTITDDEFGNPCIIFDVDDQAAHLVFGYEKGFTKFDLPILFDLDKASQQYFYMILKENAFRGELTISYSELLARLFLSPNYEWHQFKIKFLNPTQIKFQESTDIVFDYYEDKSGRSHKVTGIKFKIRKNKAYRCLLPIPELYTSAMLKKHKEPSTDVNTNDAIDVEARETTEQKLITSQKSIPKSRVLYSCVPEDWKSMYQDDNLFSVFQTTDAESFELCYNHARQIVLRDRKDQIEMQRHDVGDDAIDVVIYQYLRDSLLRVDLMDKKARAKGKKPIRDKVAYLRKMLEDSLKENRLEQEATPSGSSFTDNELDELQRKAVGKTLEK